MSDIRDLLNDRRDELAQTWMLDRVMLEKRGVDTESYRKALDRQKEREHIEATLATFQLADAQRELVAAQERATEAQILATAEQRVANAAASQEKKDADEAASKAKIVEEEVTFWTRRFMTSMSIANAAGFIAVLTFMFKQDSPAIQSRDVRLALAYFGIGAIMGGLVPVIHLMTIWARSYFGGRLKEIEQQPGGPSSSLKFMLTVNNAFYGNRYLTWVYVLSGFSLFAWALVITVGCATGYYDARIKYEADMARHRVEARAGG